jgi:hypothetical protein
LKIPSAEPGGVHPVTAAEPTAPSGHISFGWPEDIVLIVKLHWPPHTPAMQLRVCWHARQHSTRFVAGMGDDTVVLPEGYTRLSPQFWPLQFGYSVATAVATAVVVCRALVCQ